MTPKKAVKKLKSMFPKHSCNASISVWIHQHLYDADTSEESIYQIYYSKPGSQDKGIQIESNESFEKCFEQFEQKGK